MAYTVAIIDDEIYAIQHLRNLLAENVPGCTVSAHFTDAREALAAPEVQAADIVIVDIIMPLMNGLDFAEQHLAQNPHSKVVLLTAYKDFGFAQKAVRVGIFDYWVKHELRKGNIAAKMAAVTEAVDQQRRLAQKVLGRDLLDALDGRASFDALLPGREAGGLFLLYSWGTNGPPTPPAAKNIRLTPFLPIGQAQVAAGAVVGCTADKIPARHAAFCAALLAGATGGWLCSEPFAAGDYTPHLHSGCMAALDNCLADPAALLPLRTGQLLALQPDDQLPLELERESLQAIQRAAEDLDGGALFAALDGLWRHPALQAGNRKATLYAAERLLAVADACGLHHTLQTGMPGMGQWEIRQTLYALFEPLRGGVDAEENQSQKIRRVRAYIRKNLNGDLRLATLTHHFAISGDHLRKLFRQETGVTLSEYITNERIEAAKRLLATGEYKIYEIADRVGYSSPQYFSQAFYKATGQYPTEYL